MVNKECREWYKRNSIMETNQNTTNINEKRYIANKKLIICETVFCGLATRSVNIVIEMLITENNIHYWVVIDRNECYRRALKKWNI
jgi:hypothetical protein